MDVTSQRDLAILTEISQRQGVTQRGLSQHLGIALGLTNLYLKRLVRKGYVKITTVPPNRLRYLLTPQGIGEKTRLTYEYMTFSLELYRRMRRTLREGLQASLGEGPKRVALYGAGEAAELAYLTLREVGIEPVAVYGDGAAMCVGLPVRRRDELEGADFDCVIVASFSHLPSDERADLERRAGAGKLIFLRRPEPE
jgi:DNA-binding MarR family transcriptional regulator